MQINKSKIIEQIILIDDENTNKYFINNKETDLSTWLQIKGTWDLAVSYNNNQKYVKKWGFTDCDIDRNNKNVYKFIFTTYEQ